MNILLLEVHPATTWLPSSLWAFQRLLGVGLVEVCRCFTFLVDGVKHADRSWLALHVLLLCLMGQSCATLVQLLHRACFEVGTHMI